MTPVSEGKLTRFQRALELLSADRKWIESQLDMKHWEQDAARLLETMDAWIEKYTHQILGDSFAPNETQYDGFLRRLWQCWLFHWQEGAKRSPDGRLNGIVVAGRLDAADHSLVRDVILAEGIVQGHKAALECLLREDNGRIQTATERANPRFGDEGWSQTLSKLFPLEAEICTNCVGEPGSDPPTSREAVRQESVLKDYAGQGSLSQYLRRIAINYACAQARRKSNRGQALENGTSQYADVRAKNPVDESSEREIRKKATAARADCERLYETVVRDALHRLSPEHRVALYFKVIDRKSNEVVAAILGICRENVWRRLDKATKLLESYLAASPALDENQRRQFAECRRWLFAGGDTASLAAKLADMIREYAPESQGGGGEP